MWSKRALLQSLGFHTHSGTKWLLFVDRNISVKFTPLTAFFGPTTKFLGTDVFRCIVGHISHKWESKLSQTWKMCIFDIWMTKKLRLAEQIWRFKTLPKVVSMDHFGYVIGDLLGGTGAPKPWVKFWAWEDLLFSKCRSREFNEHFWLCMERQKNIFPASTDDKCDKQLAYIVRGCLEGDESRIVPWTFACNGWVKLRLKADSFVFFLRKYLSYINIHWRFDTPMTTVWQTILMLLHHNHLGMS